MNSSHQHDYESDNALEKAIWDDPALLAALELVDTQQNEQLEQAKKRRRLAQYSWGCGAVAACFAIFMWTLMPLNEQRSIPASNLVAVQQFSSDTAQQVSLSDGTQVAMNVHAQLEFTENSQTRKAILTKGEAYFSVHRDESRPFTIDAGNATIEVLGTAFNVDKTLRETLVEVFHGKVSVTSLDGLQHVELVKGQRARVSDSAIQVSQFNALQPDWQQGWLDLDNVSINDALFQLNRYSEKPVVLKNVSADIQVSGRFAVNDIFGAAKLIAQLNTLDVKQYPDSIELSKKARN
ncbi:FecR domain-containing protein [Pseudoalteromonas sp. L21]|uniref:FecR family protein n=1 Tax=Pseudoalteromonas sp. L21 TaxID=1539746 RepID=UPI00187E2B34|nr:MULTISPECIES: FecR domain-containing protein [Gammaproteobacteria]MCF7517469.1 FecR domain-containing protein [Pseudoalteromonas sp. L21]|tara:strand:- start:531 stop:1412 length:882 start_codon:yes stop_codon:yes gene_type:complete